jgi:hypothetical protein
MVRLTGILLRLAMAALASAAGGGAAAFVPLLLLGKGWPPINGLQDAIMAVFAVPLYVLFASLLGAVGGLFIASPWTALAGTVLLTASDRLKLRSVVPWLGTGLLGGMMLASLTPWRSFVLDRSGFPLLLAAGALGGMAAAWLFRRTWLAMAGAEKDEVPTF